MHKEIEKAILRFNIESKETRKSMGIRIAAFIILLVFTYWGMRDYSSQLNAFLALWLIIMLLFGAYVFLGAIPIFINPLIKEYQAFKNIAKAIEILEKSRESVLIEEAMRCFRAAINKLEYSIDQTESASMWYKKIDETLGKFIENLKLIVIPAIADSRIEIKHMEEVALAI